jgi:hypothetical protein
MNVENSVETVVRWLCPDCLLPFEVVFSWPADVPVKRTTPHLRSRSKTKQCSIVFTISVVGQGTSAIVEAHTLSQEPLPPQRREGKKTHRQR